MGGRPTMLRDEEARVINLWHDSKLPEWICAQQTHDREAGLRPGMMERTPKRTREPKRKREWPVRGCVQRQELSYVRKRGITPTSAHIIPQADGKAIRRNAARGTARRGGQCGRGQARWTGAGAECRVLGTWRGPLPERVP